MARCWVVLLFIGMVTTLSFRKTPPLNYDQARDFVIQQYNMESHSEFLFRLLYAEIQLNWNPNSTKIQTFSLKIRETVCKGDPEEVDIDSCDYKNKGVTKACNGSYLYQGGCPPLACTTILCT